MKNIMKLTIVVKSSLVALLLLGGNVMASQSSIEWSNPEKFTDIDASNESKRHFKKRLFSSFEKHFTNLGEQLPEGYSWKIKITDLDLAGTVSNKYAPGLTDMRVIDDWFRPQITFSYEVLNAQGEVVAAAEEYRLRENLIERFPGRSFMRKEFSYEKHMIKKWFKKSLLPELG